MPVFETVEKNGKQMVKVFNSSFYKGGKGGIRYIGEDTLEKSNTLLGKAFKISKGLKKISKGLVILNGAISFVSELFDSDEELSTAEKVTNGFVEGLWSISSTAAIGAAVGSIIPGAGTILGALVGFLVGLGLSIASDIFVHAKILNNRSMSIMDYLKKYANDFREFLVDRCINTYESPCAEGE